MTPALFQWIKTYAETKNLLNSCVCEIGSRSAEGQEHMGMKKLFPNHLGIDIKRGHGVDIVADMTAKPSSHRIAVHRAVRGADLVLCLETIEHVPRFWRLLSNVRHYSNPGAHLILSAPGIGFPFHPHPVDCYRFTAQGLRLLLADHWGIEAMADLRDTDNNLGHVIAGVKL